MISPPKWGTHAEIRARYYGIEMYQIAEAWIFGEVEPSKSQEGCWRLIGSDVTLILNADKSFIISLYPTRYKDRHKGERAANCKSVGMTRFED